MTTNKKRIATGAATLAILAAFGLGAAAYTGLLWQQQAHDPAQPGTEHPPAPYRDIDDMMNMGE